MNEGININNNDLEKNKDLKVIKMVEDVKKSLDFIVSFSSILSGDNNLNKEETENYIEKIYDLSEESYGIVLQYLQEYKINSDNDVKALKINKSINGIIHDIKGQFNSIVGFSELLKEDFSILTNEEIREYSNSINQSSKNAINISNNFIKNFEKIISGEEIELEISKFELSPYINKFIVPLRQKAKDKGIELINTVSGKDSVLADPEILMSVLMNLIGNAIKFSFPNGEIIISSKTYGDSINIYIKDSGVGISKERLNNFFESIGNTTLGTKGEEGTGIGLNDSMENLKKINGTINVESEGDGRGSTFIIKLPSGDNK